MTAVWAVIAALCLGTVILRAAGPVILGQRRPPGAAMSVIALVAPAILTGLVVYETFAGRRSGLVADARIVGVLVAATAALLKLPMVVVVILAAAATALTRLLL